MKRTLAWVFAALAILGASSRARAEDRRRGLKVREVVAIAVRVAQRAGPPHTERVRRRARLSGLLPQLKLAARRGLEEGRSLTSTRSADRSDASLGAELSLEASLSFQLDRLVFAPEEVRLLSLERWLAADRRKLVEDVVHLYFQRARLAAERHAEGGATNPERDATLAELTALLDEYTDGAFSVALQSEPAADPDAHDAGSGPGRAQAR